jgi:xanthine dehydrogenase accessory factor
MNKDTLDTIKKWLAENQAVTIATVIKTWGSSPRPAGSNMLVSSSRNIFGSVSGGCVEGAVIDAALDVLKTGEPASLHFGVSDDQAWDVGLTCGGEIDVYIRKFSPEEVSKIESVLDHTGKLLLVLITDGENPLVGQQLYIKDKVTEEQINKTGLSQKVIQEIKKLLKSDKNVSLQLADPPQFEVFCQLIMPAPTLIVVGASHIALPLINLAHLLGFEVVLIDPRRIFANQERFPDLKLLLSEWPDSAFHEVPLDPATALVTITHDPKIDDPALSVGLKSNAFYIGALGSKKTHQKRLQRLQEAGFEPAELKRIHAPVGLDLGGRSPEEIALSIMAEIIQVWNEIN